MDNSYFDKNPQKSTSFYAAIILLTLFFLLSFGVDITEYAQHGEINIPSWFSYVILGIDFLMLFSIVSIFIYRKIGVFLYPLLIIMHLFLHEFYLSTLLYADLFNLFAFIGLGLLAIIPKWNFFK